MNGRRWLGVTSAAGIFVVINADAIETVTPSQNLINLRSGNEIVLHETSMDALILHLGWRRPGKDEKDEKPTSPG